MVIPRQALSVSEIHCFVVGPQIFLVAVAACFREGSEQPALGTACCCWMELVWDQASAGQPSRDRGYRHLEQSDKNRGGEHPAGARVRCAASCQTIVPLCGQECFLQVAGQPAVGAGRGMSGLSEAAQALGQDMSKGCLPHFLCLVMASLGRVRAVMVAEGQVGERSTAFSRGD